MLQRSIAPSFEKVEQVNLPLPEKVLLKNGIPVYFISGNEQDVVKIEIIFRGGNWNEEQPLTATAATSLITEGTSKHTGEEIADKLDFYGSYVHQECATDYVSITLYSLNRYLEKVLPLFHEIIFDSVFPEKELHLFKNINKQRLNINNEKISFVTKHLFNQAMFGENHPYGYYPSTSDYENLTRESIIKYYKNNFRTGNCTIIVAGKINNTHHLLLDEIFGEEIEAEILQNVPSVFSNGNNEKQHLVVKPGALQSAIRVGGKTISRLHLDFHGFLILNTILGGYFGSRLMSNLREERGYTYGVGSGIQSYLHASILIISTEVKADVRADAVNQIYHEIKKLKEDVVGDEELETVKNYLTGSFLRSIDGPFALSERLKSVLLFGLDFNYYYKFFNTIRVITPAEIQALAAKYFDFNELYEVVVGK